MLTRDEQTEPLQGAAYRTPWRTKMLEKDVWVVSTLDALFRQRNAPRCAFKGGACLSKVYGAIHRFSEDVDITLDPDHPTYAKLLRSTSFPTSTRRSSETALALAGRLLKA